MPVHQNTTNADSAIMSTDVVRLLQEVGSPEQLDVSGQDLRGNQPDKLQLEESQPESSQGLRSEPVRGPAFQGRFTRSRPARNVPELD